MKAKGYSNISGLENATPEEIKQRNIEHYGSKIKKFRNKAGLTVDQLADILEISKSSIRNWECGLTRPDPEFLYRMFSILDVEPNEFFGIKGIGTLLTVDEKELLNDYRDLDASGREAVTILARGLIDKMYAKKLRISYFKEADVINYGHYFAAGDQSTPWEDYSEGEQVILHNGPAVSQADEIITVSGSSMEPQFQSGDKVLIKYCTDIRNGDIGCFYVPGIGGVIKQKAYDRLHSLNPKYDDIIVNEEGATVIGIVLGKITKDMIPTAEEQMLYQEALREQKAHPEWFE